MEIKKKQTNTTQGTQVKSEDFSLIQYKAEESGATSLKWQKENHQPRIP